jgi:hypothetical protein
MDILNADIQFGLSCEESVIERMRNYFKDDSIYKTEEQFSKYDALSFNNNKIAYEIKSRRCNKMDYNTTLIPVGKCFNMNDYDIIFVFNFQDKICYIKFDFDKFSEYELRYGLKTICRPRANGEIKPVINYQIPIEDLIDINFLN